MAFVDGDFQDQGNPEYFFFGLPKMAAQLTKINLHRLRGADHCQRHNALESPPKKHSNHLD
jgi:hypothetical protein